MGSNPTVSGVISGKLILAAGFIRSTLWRGLASCFDLDRFLRVYAFPRVRGRSEYSIREPVKNYLADFFR